MKPKTTTITTTELPMESQGVSCWDFAYPSGKCALYASAKKECILTKCGPSSASTPKPHKSHSSTKDPSQSQPRPDSPLSSSSFALTLRHRSKRDHPPPTVELRTYLMSCPSSSSVIYPHTYTTISTLLLEPRTQIILLVPQSHITCSRICDISRLPRAGGSCIQILPIPEIIDMGYASGSESEVTTSSSTTTTSPSGCDLLGGTSAAEKANVAEVVRKIVKYTKARNFDGYLVFEDDRASWQFLERVGRGVKSACKKAK